ncbi:C-terminal binding protein [Dysosmobacter sp. NSJ-60]|uniref:Dehydrogenase n=1 Tax=Pusillibacter faecalis TaxID=2714358 RepID=A0A810QDJ3_9FIRM|nr:C-terminal binding protein [Pusillibacter faecalis]MBC5746530.1 C-terminal binding protein [Dysosmobacter hominis]MBS5657394.1 C-terminal binding protein [Oscillibacter sp.]MCQ5025518.1 C-terminal binding protein [Oscillibacter valericigenes]BCK83751.1 dehydrogenase [Pusillibacter faecalis]
MKKFRVVLTDYMYETIQPFYDVYNQYEDIEFVPLQLTEKRDILRETEFADAVMVHFDQIDKDVISNLKNCRIIARSAVGYDNIDLDAASAAKIPVTNVPDYCVEEVSNHTLMMILNSAKKFNQLEANVKKGLWGDFAIAKPIHAVRGQTLGLLGCGRIARCLAVKAQVFGIKVIAYDPYIKPEAVKDFGVTLVSREELLAQSDFISMHLLLNEDTRKSINADFFKKMKNSAIFVNTARGGLVDEDALIEALRTGEIAGAALDVLTEEGIDKDAPLQKFDNVIITPHAAWYSEQAFYTLLTSAAQEVVRALHGEPVKNQVNHF